MSLNVSAAVGRVYARALLELGQQRGTAEALIEDMRGVYAALQADREFRNFYESPKVPASDKKDLLERVFRGKIADEVLALLNVLVRKHREPMVNNIIEQFEHLRDVSERRVLVDAGVAHPLDAEVRKRLVSELERVTAKSVVLKESVRPELLGGMILRVGDQVLDMTLRKKLAMLRDQALAAGEEAN